MIRAVYIERATIIRARRKQRSVDRPRPVVVMQPRAVARVSGPAIAAPTPRPRISQIDPQYPVYGTPTTQSVRDNFAAAKREIEELQERIDGGTFTTREAASADRDRYRRRLHRKGK